MNLIAAIVEVMRTAMHGSNTEPGWVTSYQVFNRLPSDVQAALVDEHEGKGGRNNDAERGTGAANAVMRVLRDHKDVQISYFDAWHDAEFSMDTDRVRPGNVTCAIYRWRPGATERYI